MWIWWVWDDPRWPLSEQNQKIKGVCNQRNLVMFDWNYSCDKVSTEGCWCLWMTKGQIFKSHTEWTIVATTMAVLLSFLSCQALRYPFYTHHLFASPQLSEGTCDFVDEDIWKRLIKMLTQDHSAHRWWSWDSDSDFLVSTLLFSTYL